jgi:chromosome partitioning protein
MSFQNYAFVKKDPSYTRDIGNIASNNHHVAQNHHASHNRANHIQGQDIQTKPDPKVIIIGNEKGGSGKTTVSIHVIAGLLDRGYSVGSIDLDCKQASLSHFVENRKKTNQTYGLDLPIPHHHHIKRLLEREDALEYAFLEALILLTKKCDYIVVDTPGTQSFISRLAHSYADLIVTPINDSFVDLDLLMQIDGETHEMQSPSIYSNMVWEQQKRRAARDQQPIRWCVLRNRLSHLNSRNKNNIQDVLKENASKIGFENIDGFSERVIFRELFLKGLTVLDLDYIQKMFKSFKEQYNQNIRDENHENIKNIADFLSDYPNTSISHIAARQEIRTIVDRVCTKK